MQVHVRLAQHQVQERALNRAKTSFCGFWDSGQRQRGRIRETKRRGNKDMEEDRGEKGREHTPNESFLALQKVCEREKGKSYNLNHFRTYNLSTLSTPTELRHHLF